MEALHNFKLLSALKVELLCSWDTSLARCLSTCLYIGVIGVCGDHHGEEIQKEVLTLVIIMAKKSRWIQMTEVNTTCRATFFLPLENTSFGDRKKIALRYAKTWLALDVISTITFELTQTLLPESLEAYRYFNMLRLWRLRRVSQMFASQIRLGQEL
ncbi:hypothetical protein ACFE04_031680 [Oxalis oulophora]